MLPAFPAHKNARSLLIFLIFCVHLHTGSFPSRSFPFNLVTRARRVKRVTDRVLWSEWPQPVCYLGVPPVSLGIFPIAGFEVLRALFMNSQPTFRRNESSQSSRSKNTCFTLVSCLACCWPQIWRLHIPPKFWLTFNELYGVISQ